MPSISVVVPVHNGETTIGDCLRALEAQKLFKAEYEIIVVDDCSTDCTVSNASRFAVQLLKLESRKGAAAARNAGLQEARSEWVAFTDHDCIPSRDWLSNLLLAVNRENKNPRALGAAGRILGYGSESGAARFVDLTRGLDAERHLMHPKFPFAPSGNMMYRRDALVGVNGFDERYCSYEACDLHYRLLKANLGSFYYEPRAVVFHRHREGWKDYWRQQFWHGQGFGQFMLHHGDEAPWSIQRELRAWGKIVTLLGGACKPGHDDSSLVRRGTFLKELAQRLGFISTYWNPFEREKW